MDTPIPRLRPDLVITPFVEGPGDTRGLFVVEAGPRCYTLNAAARAVVGAMQEGPATLGELLERCNRGAERPIGADELRRLVWEQLPATLYADTPAVPRRTPFLVQAPLVPGRFVEKASRRLTWLFARPAAALIVGTFVVVVALALPGGVSPSSAGAGTTFAVVLAFTLASMLVHEMGHAAASSRFGCPPGTIGAAIYLIFPVMYADVTRTWRLPPRQRAAVDLGGVYFQSMVASAAGIYALSTGSVLARWLLWMNVVSMVHMMNPLYKMDGYWLLTDLSGLGNLHARMSATFRALFARLFRRPAAPSQVGRVQGALLYAYCALFVVYFASVGRLVLGAALKLAAHWPARAAAGWARTAAAYQAGEMAATAARAGELALATFAPLLAWVALFFIARRVYLLFFPAAPRAGTTAPLAPREPAPATAPALARAGA